MTISANINKQMVSLFNLFIICVMAVLVSSCDNKDSAVQAGKEIQNEQKTPQSMEVVAPTKTDFVVYKSPTCGCCSDWLKHLESNGFTADFVDTEQLSEVKQKLGIPSQFASCHTALSRQGYVFEGHIPAHVIQRFLAERPSNAIGLAVPGMPLGSPGMEMGDSFEPYDVVLLRKDGKTEVFTRISSPPK